MSLRIIRNDITKMRCDAIVNTANARPVVGRGCDTAVYEAAGYRELLDYRKTKIGRREEGEAFLTPGFRLNARYIIHTVSPAYRGGNEEEELRLRACYRNSLALAREYHLKSIAFPLIATGSFQYPKEEGMRIAVDEIHAFLLQYEMEVFLVVFDDQAVRLGRRIDPKLESYIDDHYYRLREQELTSAAREPLARPEASAVRGPLSRPKASASRKIEDTARIELSQMPPPSFLNGKPAEAPSFYAGHESRLAERMNHLSDTFSEYLMYLIESKGMSNAEVYKRAIVDKKVFSKIKNNKDAHPQKMTAMCLCIGAKLNIDETRDLLARAGYALSPSSRTDVIFSYFIENRIYDMIELDIQLEEYGLPCLIS
ncbi:MAG: macro domain-containing protein [Parasporobacterium sp.]|nr:macro domain-containing protein [Parasporobacterium sp.]